MNKLLLLLALVTLTLSCETESIELEQQSEIIFPGESHPGERIVNALETKSNKILLTKTKKQKENAKIIMNRYNQLDKDGVQCIQSEDYDGHTTGVTYQNGAYYYFATNNETQQTYLSETPHSSLYMWLTGWCWALGTDITITYENKTEDGDITYDVYGNILQVIDGCVWTSYYNALNNTYGQLQPDPLCEFDSIQGKEPCIDGVQWVPEPCFDGDESLECGRYIRC